MRVFALDGVHEIISMDALESLLNTTHECGTNALWLSQGADAYPRLSLMVRDDVATLIDMPENNNAGLRSVGTMPESFRAGTTTFAISTDRADDVVVLNDAVVPFTTALKAAKEFFLTKDLPRSIEWLQL